MLQSSDRHKVPTYLHFEYKNISERFKEVKLLIPRFSIPEKFLKRKEIKTWNWRTSITGHNIHLCKIFEILYVLGENVLVLNIFIFLCLFLFLFFFFFFFFFLLHPIPYLHIISFPYILVLVECMHQQGQGSGHYILVIIHLLSLSLSLSDLFTHSPKLS